MVTARMPDGTVERYEGRDDAAALQRVEALARLMDSAVAIPGTDVRIGLDAVIGFVPVVGDLVSQVVASYIIWEARRIGVSRWTMARMIGNSAVDTVVGFIPFVGDAFDVAFRANMKNLALLRSHLEKKGARTGDGVVIDGTAERVA